MNRYAAGRRFELDVRRHLTGEGYFVMGSAGSKTVLDMVAIKPGELLLIQAKRDGKLPPSERTELLHLAGMIPEAKPILARKLSGQTEPILEQLIGAGARDRQPFSTDTIWETL